MRNKMAKFENDLIESEKKSSAGLEKLFKERSQVLMKEVEGMFDKQK